ncbi:hypothetical protein Anapl_10999 [Anas platyrhynchos]|uniref:Uncharacterized protein n=1 Tax=Anas platyrhynchos TaxID=8839 RepID=R0KQB2_ANAPL|nr:hypothetical protein Anapl_10999 [Anas platyrhynchos]
MKGTDIRSLLPLAGPVMQNAGRIQRPPLHARLLAEIKSLAICWEAKTSLSAGASSLEQALMWQSLSTIYSLGRSLCSSRVFQGTVHSSAECRVQQLPARSAAAQVPHHNPEQSCNIGESKISALKDSNIHEKPVLYELMGCASAEIVTDFPVLEYFITQLIDMIKNLFKGLRIPAPALYVIGQYLVLKETVLEYSLRSATAQQRAAPSSKEITQTSGEPRREQSMASATQRHSYMPESHCKGFAVPAKSLLGNTHVAQEGRRSPSPSAGAEAGVQELGPKGKQPRLFLSWRNIPPNPWTRTEMSRTEMKGFNQLSLPPACANQPWLAAGFQRADCMFAVETLNQYTGTKVSSNANRSSIQIRNPRNITIYLNATESKGKMCLLSWHPQIPYGNYNVSSSVYYVLTPVVFLQNIPISFTYLCSSDYNVGSEEAEATDSYRVNSQATNNLVQGLLLMKQSPLTKTEREEARNNKKRALKIKCTLSPSKAHPKAKETSPPANGKSRAQQKQHHSGRIIPYRLHAANGTILNVTSECDLFLNILIQHILDTPTRYNWNPMQSGLLYFAKQPKFKMVKSHAERNYPSSEHRHGASGFWEIVCMHRTDVSPRRRNKEHPAREQKAGSEPDLPSLQLQGWPQIPEESSKQHNKDGEGLEPALKQLHYFN